MAPHTIHLVGAGSIGSFVAYSLRQAHPSLPIRLHFRRPDLQRHAIPFPWAIPQLATHSAASSAADTVRASGIKVQEARYSISLVPFGGDPAAPVASQPYDAEFATLPPPSSSLPGETEDEMGCTIMCTKAHQLISALKPLVPRINAFRAPGVPTSVSGTRKGEATVMVLCNGITAAFPEALSELWPAENERPSFILASTSHGVHAFRPHATRSLSPNPDAPQGSEANQGGQIREGHGTFVHAGRGELQFAVLPSASLRAELSRLSAYSTTEPYSAYDLSRSTNPLLWDPDSPEAFVPPSLEQHLPLTPRTSTLHTLLALLLDRGESPLNASWLTLPDFYLSALSKLAVNSCVNALALLLGTRNGYLLGDPQARQLLRALASECAGVFKARGDDARYGAKGRELLNEAGVQRRVGEVLRATASNVSSTLAGAKPNDTERGRTLQAAGMTEAKQDDNGGGKRKRTGAVGELKYMNGWFVEQGDALSAKMRTEWEKRRSAQKQTTKLSESAPLSGGEGGADVPRGTGAEANGYVPTVNVEVNRTVWRLARARARVLQEPWLEV